MNQPVFVSVLMSIALISMGREQHAARPALESPLPAVTFPHAAGGTFLPCDHRGAYRKARAAG